jgi:hypothetical protein
MTASPPAPKPRRSRLQFSLRLLLIAFTAFAIGFPIWYRWPFEEVEHKYTYGDPFAPPGSSTGKTLNATITKTWRRTWGGGKVQHGRAVMDYKRPPKKTIEHFSNGERHGPFEDHFNGTLTRTGLFVKGRREGTWTAYYSKGNVTYKAHWKQDRLHGPYETAFEGRRKQQFLFTEGKLVGIDGQLVQNRLIEQLASGEVDDPRITGELLVPLPVGMEFVETPLQDAVAYLQDQTGIPIVVDARRVRDVDLPLTLNVQGIDLCSALTLMTAPHNLDFEYRYGVLFLTTAEKRQGLARSHGRQRHPSAGRECLGPRLERAELDGLRRDPARRRSRIPG